MKTVLFLLCLLTMTSMAHAEVEASPEVKLCTVYQAGIGSAAGLKAMYSMLGNKEGVEFYGNLERELMAKYQGFQCDERLKPSRLELERVQKCKALSERANSLRLALISAGESAPRGGMDRVISIMHAREEVLNEMKALGCELPIR